MRYIDASTGEWARRGVDLTAAEQEQLLAALAQVYRDQETAEGILRRIGFPRDRRPAWTGNTTPESWWRQIFDELESGIIAPPPFLRLLAAVLRAYEYHPVLRPIAIKYGVLVPEGPEATAPPERQTCRVIIRTGSEDLRSKAFRQLGRLDLKPVEEWSTLDASCYRVNSSDAGFVRRVMDRTNLDWVVVPPGQPDYLLRQLLVQGPDGRQFGLIDTLAQQTVADVAARLIDQYYREYTESPLPIVVDHVGPDGQGQRLDPEETLHEAGVRDGDSLRLVPEPRVTRGGQYRGPGEEPPRRRGPHGERFIGVWLDERPDGANSPLRVGEWYLLNFKVGRPVPTSLIRGGDAVVPSSDVPPGGLPTEWAVVSSTVQLAPVTPDTSVQVLPGPAWAARFGLHVPQQGESRTVQLQVTPCPDSDGRLDITIEVGNELYRQFTVVLGSGDARVRDEVIHSPARHLGLPPTHEWTTPCGTLTIVVFNGGAHVKGDTRNGPVDQFFVWSGTQAGVAGKIENLREAADRFRVRWQDYLNDIPPDDLLNRLRPSVGPSSWEQWDWSQRDDRADDDHRRAWNEVERSDELRELAFHGYKLYDAFFPDDSSLRQWLDEFWPGCLVRLSWLKSSGPGWIPQVPWGLLYVFGPPGRGEPVDPTGFWGLRFRIDYTAYEVSVPSRFLGSLERTHHAHCLYWGSGTNDETGVEARWQREQWAVWRNSVFAPASPDEPNGRDHVVRLLDDPGHSPLSVLYVFCQCSVGSGRKPQLRFANTRDASDNIEGADLGYRQFVDRPLVFVNACSTAGADPYIANELVEMFFDRKCRGYLGTEAKVPIQLASRFASVFFSFFYRQVDPEPIAAGEAVVQSRRFLWTHYRNIGGLFYAYINQYQLFMADDHELASTLTW